MAVRKSVFYCGDCGHEEPRWLGRCPGCGAWNTFKERNLAEKSRPSRGGFIQEEGHPRRYTEIGSEENIRLSTGMPEIDRVLGGGMVPGSAILLGGEPGIGKSTLMLQLCRELSSLTSVLYVSGEESTAQVKMRGDRLGIDSDKLLLYSATGLEEIINAAEQEHPALLIIDSIQTVQSASAGDIPGTINQLKFCSFELIRFAKAHKTVLFLLAHVTKEGNIAGPKAIEHMVDTVLLFDPLEGEYRSLRPIKNRFGPTDEIGLMIMDHTGLKQIADPAAVFMDATRKEIPPGVSIGAVYEGSRILLVEIQALTVAGKGGGARNYSERIDPIRISRIAAILEKYTGIRLTDQDLYVNVAGGFKITDIGCDLAVALALYSARSGLSLKKGLMGLGELSLSGEIRPLNHLTRRIKTAEEAGFTEILSPVKEQNRDGVIPVHHIREAIRAAFQPEKREMKTETIC